MKKSHVARALVVAIALIEAPVMVFSMTSVTRAQTGGAQDVMTRAKEAARKQSIEEYAIRNAFAETWSATVENDRIVLRFTVNEGTRIPNCESISYFYVVSGIPAPSRSLFFGNTDQSLRAGGSEERPVAISWLRDMVGIKDERKQCGVLFQLWVGPENSKCRYLVGERMIYLESTDAK